MKIRISKILYLVLFLSVSLLATEATAKKNSPPETSHDGLVLVEKTKYVDVLYLAPGADLSGYEKVMLMKPHVAFQKDWKRSYNSSARMMDRIDDRDIAKMIDRITDLFGHEFVDTIEKKGYPVVQEAGADVLLLRPSIIDIRVTVPDPDKTKGLGRGGVYAEDAGDMTFVLELYDSVSQNILARAIEHERDIDEGWRIPRDYFSNANAARRAFDQWARQLAKGLDRAKEAKAEEVEE